MRVLLLFLLAATTVQARETLPKILIFGKALRSNHEKIVPLAGKALVALSKANGFNPTFSDDPVIFSKLSQFTTVIFLDVSQGVLDTEQKIAFEKYIEQGGGLVATVRKTSPEMTNVADSWTQSDEWFNYTNLISEQHHILVSVDEGSCLVHGNGPPNF